MGTRKNYRVRNTGESVFSAADYGADKTVEKVIRKLLKVKPSNRWDLANAVERDARTRKKKAFTMPTVSILGVHRPQD